MVKNPGTDQVPWAPFQVFQIRLIPDASTFGIQKTYTTVGGEEHVYEYERQHYLGHRQRDEKFNAIYKKFNVPYYTSPTGGSFTRARWTPDTFTLAIGVVDLSARHDEPSINEDASQPSISYELLFEFLDAKGFKPLTTLFKFRKQIEREMEVAINRVVRSKGVISKQTFIDAISSVGRKWVKEVHAYIYGGEKPNLKEKTTDYFRPKKQEIDSSLYPAGIDTPLVESGQLAEAIDFSVFVDQSEEIKHYLQDMKKIEKRIREEMKKSERQRKRQKEKADKQRQKRHQDVEVKEVQYRKNATQKQIEEDIEKRDELEIKRRRKQESSDFETTAEYAAKSAITAFRNYFKSTSEIYQTRDFKKWPEYEQESMKIRYKEYTDAITYLRTIAAGKLFLTKYGIPV